MFRPQFGASLGRYRVLDQVGAGGMGIVCRAHDERLSRDVALKFLPVGALADEDARRRFRHEALALAKLSHPNIATIFDFETHDEIDFLVIEYIPGETLDTVTAHRVLEEPEVVRLGEQLAAGLTAAHDRGVLHRDLKPGNLRVTPDGLLKILDFGLAKLFDIAETAALTIDSVPEGASQTGFAGTPAYMAPEQILRGHVDVRTDVFASGAVLYELVCGRRPFPQSDPAELMNAIVHGSPVSPGSIARISAGLEAVIVKAMAKSPADRYQSARELGADLRALATAFPRPRVRRTVDSIAVLPFENATGDPQAEYVVEGVTEAAIRALSAVPSLKKVIARNSVYRYRGRDITPEQAGRELDVKAVLVARVRQRDDVLVFDAELIDTANSRHLWGGQYERNRGHLSGVEHWIADGIGKTLGVRRRSAKPASARGSSAADAYHLYLKGRFYWNKRPGAGMVQKAIELFQQATEADPSFALGYAGLADCYNTLGAWEASGLDPRVAFPQAMLAARRALRLDSHLAEAHAARAYTALHYDWDWSEAEAGFRRAMQLNANYVHCRHWYAHFLIAIGRTREALAESRHLIELDPLDLVMNAHLAWHYQMAHDFPAALDSANRTLELEPHFHWGHFFAGWAYEQLGEHDRAIDALRQSSELSGGSTVMRAALAHAYARAGENAAALRELDDLRSAGRTGYLSAYEIALVHMALKETEVGWQWLERACDERSGWMPYVIAEPRLSHLHTDPRFHALVERVGLSTGNAP